MTALVGAAAGGAAPGTPPDTEPVDEPVAGKKRRRWTPYLLLLPGGLWLLLFFVVPTIQLAGTSLYDRAGSLENGYSQAFAFVNYVDAIAAYWPHLRALRGLRGHRDDHLPGARLPAGVRDRAEGRPVAQPDAGAA